ncbi:competence protein ComEC [Alsobacter soli]|uniref:Competence protein ComEC n=1 Tax=Alsobacter soli TaxID=2109933 RepID=A0A2T1HS16_9HYPH|nr:ComEC/Rec2 family competence protein [Alsobacter soli]PSC04444.1 competence protein ComEC [Alsobacter soli]
MGRGGTSADRARAVAQALRAGRLVGGAGALPSLGEALAAGGAGLRRLFEREAEERRLFLWLPAALGLGVLLYFAADQEPALWAPALACALAAAAALKLSSRSRLGFVAAVGVTAVFAGFVAAASRTRLVAAPALERVRVGKLTGFVEAAETRMAGGRLMIRVLSLEGLAPDKIPYRVRVTTPNRPSVKPGDAIRATARLLPPPEPSRPGGYNFARDAYFGAIGAVGSLAGKIELEPGAPEPPADLRLLAAVDRARNDMTERIARSIGGAAGGVAAALVTGKRGLIPEDANDDLRAAGIYHVVSISGLHLVLAAGMVFWIVRAALALSPGMVLGRPIKKWAAACAMVAGTGYTVFAGGDVATVRSLVMTLVLLGAILVDRPALSMRNLAIAAILILLIEPESVLAPGFQMSFAAVAALIAVFERPGQSGADPEAGTFTGLGLPEPKARQAPPGGWLARLARAFRHHLVGTVLSTLVAEAATGAYGLYHFQRYTPFGLVGNALTLPLVSLIIMPAALLGAVAYPFGWDGPVWQAMGWGVEGMLRIAAKVRSWPGSTQAMPAFGVGAVLLLTLAILWLTLWRTGLRWGGLAFAAAGIGLAGNAHAPDIVVARDGRALAVRASDGRLAIVGRQAGAFVTEQWLRADGDMRDPGDPSLGAPVRCDPQGCVVRLPDGRAVSQALSPMAFEDDCRRAAVIVTPLTAPAWCDRPLVLDRKRLQASGATALTAMAEGFTAATERSDLRDRPWLPRRPSPPPPADRAKGSPAPAKPEQSAQAAAPGPSKTSRAAPDPAQPQSGEDGEEDAFAPDR